MTTKGEEEDIVGACKATDDEVLRRHIMDRRIPKSEAEHWAKQEIERLQGELKEAREQQNAKRITIRYMPRDDGGLRIWADDLPGLILSHADPSAAWRDLGVAIENLLSKSPSASIRSQTIEECAKAAEIAIGPVYFVDGKPNAGVVVGGDIIAKAIRSLDSNGGGE